MGDWTVHVGWREGHETAYARASWREAERAARAYTGLRRAVRVVVRGPDGYIAAEWHRATGLWLEYNPPLDEAA